MPRDSARAPQLPLFLHDPAASPEALARYEAIRPVLKGERSLPQQSQLTGISHWRLWRDLRRFQRAGLLGLIDQHTRPYRGVENDSCKIPDGTLNALTNIGLSNVPYVGFSVSNL